MPVAALEATKSVFELTSSLAGTVVEVLVAEGETVPVGTPLFKVRTDQASVRAKPLTKERPGTPVLTRRPAVGRLRLTRHATEPRRFDVGMSSIATVCGSRLVQNGELLHGGAHELTAQRTVDDIVQRTGIECRHWIAPGENAINMAVSACRSLLERERLAPTDLDVLICSTTSPTTVAPSMACQVLQELMQGKHGTWTQAYDIHAACSGYLYALQAGYDHLQSTPNGRVLIVTAEVLSPLLDPADFDTVVLFGDAASATVLYGESHFSQASGRLLRPELSAKGDSDAALYVPLPHSGFIQMKGRRVFTEAVRAMVSSLNRVCTREGLQVNDLDLIVPHQANQRILDAIQGRVEPRVFSNIRRHGNTSSTSIPLCLAEILPGVHSGDRLGLCAFGGGFTFGASILQAV
jgi:2-oxoisovalerate dehydrogenase E1 component